MLKVGDLVRMRMHARHDDTLGIVVGLHDPVDSTRVLIKWNDGDRVDPERVDWLEILSESTKK